MFGRKKKEDAEFQALASSWGMTYAAKDKALRDRPFDLFEYSNRTLRAVISGPWRGRSLSVFNYWFHEVVMRGSRPGLGRTISFTCGVADLAASVSPTRVEGHGAYGWVSKPKGVTEMEAAPGIKVTASDPSFAESLLTPVIRAWLAEGGEGWAFELKEGAVLCSTGQRPATEWPQVLDKLSDFLDLLSPGMAPSSGG